MEIDPEYINILTNINEIVNYMNQFLIEIESINGKCYAEILYDNKGEIRKIYNRTKKDTKDMLANCWSSITIIKNNKIYNKSCNAFDIWVKDPGKRKMDHESFKIIMKELREKEREKNPKKDPDEHELNNIIWNK
jgi:hypothetical protein